MDMVFSRQERKKFQGFAILSTWFGCVSEQLLFSNSFIIIYLTTLGGNESFSMLSTTLGALCGIFMTIPCAGLINRIGLRKSYSFSVYSAFTAFLLMAAAPTIVPEAWAKYLVIGGCLLFNLTTFPYSIAWYPMLDMILAPEERGGFFGKMRFSYVLINAGIIYLIGKLLGKNPPIYIMQIVIAVAGILALGRKFCMDKMPDNPEVRNSKLEISKALNISIRNASLVGFSFYSCFFNCATASTLPLAIIYMQNALKFTPETIMTATSLYMVGQVCGFGIAGQLMRKIGHRWFQITTHTLFTFIIGCLAITRSGIPGLVILMTALMWTLGVAASLFSCLNSTEMLASAKPGNKVMATAFCQTFTNIGSAIGRIGATLVLASGALAAEWKCFGIPMSCYNFMFMFYFALIVFFYLMLLLSPSIISKHDDYYDP